MKLTKTKLKQIIREEIQNVLMEQDPRSKMDRWIATKPIENLLGKPFLMPGAEFVLHSDVTHDAQGVRAVSKNIAGNPGDPGYSENPSWAAGEGNDDEAYQIHTKDLMPGGKASGPHPPAQLGE